MFKQLSRPDLADLLLRAGLALIFLSHGGLKLAFSMTAWNPDLHPVVNAAVAWGEILLGLLVLLGLFTRLAAAGMIVIMLAAIALVTGKQDFVHLTLGKPGGERRDALYVGINRLSPGYEYNVAIIVMAGALILLGSGPYSLDELRRRKAARPAAAGPAPAPAPEPAPAPAAPAGPAPPAPSSV
jgi:putative oxidoreductase